MTVNDIAKILEELAPLAHAEEFDNVGLLVGDPNMKVEWYHNRQLVTASKPRKILRFID